MRLINNIKEGVRAKMRSFLDIRETTTTTALSIDQDMTHEVNVGLHKILYRTDSYETQQAFKLLNSSSTLGRFWASVPYGRARKIRNDLYQVIIDTYSDICTNALNAPEFEDKAKEDLFNEIFSDKNEQNLWTLTKKAITDCLKTGDGAFKISCDPDISHFPIVEFIDAEFVDYEYRRGKLVEIIFYSHFYENHKKYVLKEHYGKGYIKYELFEDEKPVPLNTLKRLAYLSDITFSGSYIMAQQFKIWDSPKYTGRGKPLLDGKLDEIDALDEIISQWMDALRSGRVKKYIPSSLIPVDEQGRLKNPSEFNDNFIEIQGSISEAAEDKITVVQPDIEYEAFLSSYVASLDRCLMGIISPSTLGIDARKLDDNATAQREREKITGWKRNQITNVLADVIPSLINKVLKTYENMTGELVDDSTIEVSFDEYNSPGIEQKLEVAAKGAPGVQLLTYKQIAEIICDDKTNEEQEEIAAALESLNNPTIEEPAMFPNDFEKEDSLDIE